MPTVRIPPPLRHTILLRCQLRWLRTSTPLDHTMYGIYLIVRGQYGVRGHRTSLRKIRVDLRGPCSVARAYIMGNTEYYIFRCQITRILHSRVENMHRHIVALTNHRKWGADYKIFFRNFLNPAKEHLFNLQHAKKRTPVLQGTPPKHDNIVITAACCWHWVLLPSMNVRISICSSRIY